jgi:hypothetical protein
MDFFGTSATSRAKKARLAAENTRRNLQECNNHLRHMDALLLHLQREVPKNISGEVIRPLQRTLELTERHTEQTLLHMKNLEKHVSRLEEQMRSAKEKR